MNSKMKVMLFLLIVSPILLSAEDPYDKLAQDIAAASDSLPNKKIAIIPFSYTDNAASVKDGSVIAERLTMKLINIRKFEIIERSVLDKVLNELKLQNSGVIDATSAKELGKVLGVEAIVTGTLVQTTEGKIEVNARLIKTETAQAIVASQVYVARDWLGGDAERLAQQEQPVQVQTGYQQENSYPARGKYQYGFFDIMLGGGSQTIDMRFNNTVYNENFSDLGITGWSGNYTTIEFQDIVGRGVGPIGFRVGWFGNGSIGGDFEFSVSKHSFDRQTINVKTNTETEKVTFYVNDYMDVTSFGFSGDLLIRIPKEKADHYFGVGLGLSFNKIDLPYVKGYTNSSGNYSVPTDDFGVGLIFRIPIGIRVKFNPKTHFYAELRYELNSMTYDRGIKNETDTITAAGARFVTGVGFAF